LKDSRASRSVEVVKITIPSYSGNLERCASIDYLGDLLQKNGVNRKEALICVTAAFHYLHEELKYNGIDRVKKIIDYSGAHCRTATGTWDYLDGKKSDLL